MIEFINLQRKIAVDAAALREFTSNLLAFVPEVSDRPFSIALISDSRMKDLNSLFRGTDATTDVLSFPRQPDDFDPDKNNLGDVVIAAGQAKKQAAENGLSLDNEIKQLILHGLLHLCGYDHESDAGEMNARELELRAKLKI